MSYRPMQKGKIPISKDGHLWTMFAYLNMNRHDVVINFGCSSATVDSSSTRSVVITRQPHVSLRSGAVKVSSQCWRCAWRLGRHDVQSRHDCLLCFEKRIGNRRLSLMRNIFDYVIASVLGSESVR